MLSHMDTTSLVYVVLGLGLLISDDVRFSQLDQHILDVAEDLGDLATKPSADRSPLFWENEVIHLTPAERLGLLLAIADYYRQSLAEAVAMIFLGGLLLGFSAEERVAAFALFLVAAVIGYRARRRLQACQDDMERTHASLEKSSSSKDATA